MAGTDATSQGSSITISNFRNYLFKDPISKNISQMDDGGRVCRYNREIPLLEELYLVV
jgi:hypothetical protein